VKQTPTRKAEYKQDCNAGVNRLQLAEARCQPAFLQRCPCSQRHLADTTEHAVEIALMARLILTVDDSPSIRLMMHLTLTGEGYEVVQTSDGIEALEFAREHNADLVLTDINMPRMDGLTLIRELRLLPAYKVVPMLVLTTEAGQDKKSLGKEAGATGWLVKPFNTQQLLSTIARVL
jgi:two-component system chemotaxis response regulator CheY